MTTAKSATPNQTAAPQSVRPVPAPSDAGERLDPERIAVMFLLSSVLGLTLVANQIGEALSKLVHWSWLTPFWAVNGPIGNLVGRNAFLLIILGLAIVYFLVWMRHPSPYIRRAFYLGVLTGALIIPALVLAITAFALALWLLFVVVKWVFGIVIVIFSWLGTNVGKPVFAFIGIPFVWLWEEWIGPVLSVLASPFVWLWENALEPVLSYVSIPFVWLWGNALLPLLEFLFFVVLKWVAIIALMLLVATPLVLIGFAIVWKVFEESFRTAAYKEFNVVNVFACGMGIGLFMFDIAISVTLNLLGILSFFPAISHYLVLLIPIVFLLRLVLSLRHSFPNVHPMSYRDCGTAYWKTSKLEVIVMAAALPVFLIVSLMARDES